MGAHAVNGIFVGFLSGSGGDDQAAQAVDREQQKIDHTAVRTRTSVAQRIEPRLEHVRERGHFLETEGAAAALDGMGRAEDGIENFRIGRHGIVAVVGRGLFQAQQLRFHARQPLEALLEEGLVELAHIDGHGLIPGLF